MNHFYNLTLDGHPTAAIGNEGRMKAILDWNDIVSPDKSWNLVAIPEAEAKDWDKQFLNPTDRGMENLSPKIDYPPGGSLVQSLFAFAAKSGFSLIYSKDLWRDILFILKSPPGTQFLWACKSHSTRSRALDFDSTRIYHHQQEIVDYRNALDSFEHCVTHDGFEHCALVQATAIGNPVDGLLTLVEGIVTPTPKEAITPFLDGHRAALPPMPDLSRDDSVLEIPPEHQEFFSTLWQKAESAGVGDALEEAMNRCISFACERVWYKCVLMPHSYDGDGMSFTAQPMTRGYKTPIGTWDRIIFFGVIYDPSTKQWRFNS